MKTGAKLCLTALAAVLGCGLGLTGPVFAQGTAASAVPPGPITTAVPGPAAAAPASSGTKAASAALPSTIDLTEKSLDEKKGKNGKADNDIPPPSPKVPDSVNSIVKRLNTATQDVTLEDLNAAREAVVKLDVLIDIEKRLNDLSSLRREREEKSASALAAVLPASALGLPSPARGGMSPFPTMPAQAGGLPTNPLSGASVPGFGGVAPVVTPPVITGPTDYEVVRILGSGGRYVATIKESENKIKRIREGDKLGDGSRVEAVTRSSVTLVKNAKTKTLHVKDVMQVFGSR